MIAPQGADFTAIHRGVFWVRASASTHYDAKSKMFVTEQGPQSRWADAMKKLGATDVVITSTPVDGIPAARVTAKLKGQAIYMLYLAASPDPATPAILINYHPPAKAAAVDDQVWARFLGK